MPQDQAVRAGEAAKAGPPSPADGPASACRGGKPIIELKVCGPQLLIVGNVPGLRLLSDILSNRQAGTAYAERVMAGEGSPGIVIALCCDDDEVEGIGADHPLVQAALDDLFSYYAVEVPDAEEERFGLFRGGLVI